MRLPRWLILTLIVALSGCQALHPTPLVGLDRTGESPTYNVQGDRSIAGRVDFGPARSVQATPGQVVDSATVSFIDMTTNATVATGKTNAAGNFSLSVGSYPLTTGATYLLEAVKGLNAQAPGADAARFRTILQWNGSAWLSCSNGAPGGTILINALTTALAVETALDPANVPAVLTIGKVNPASTPASLNATPGPYTSHPDSQINQLATDLIDYLGVNADPLASVPAIVPTVTSFSPTSGVANSLIQIMGAGFSVVPTGNTVTVNGAAAQVVLATPTSLIVTVPAGATTGKIRIVTGRGTFTTGGDFTVATAGGGGSGGGGSAASFGITSFSPTIGRTDTLVTLSGAFGVATPSIVFPGASGTIPAQVTAWSATSMTVRVPMGAQSGPITIGSGYQTASSLLNFTILPGDLNTFSSVTAVSAGAPYSLPEGIQYSAGAASGSFYFITGGTDGSSTYYSTVRGFSINPDGSLSPIRTLSQLRTTRYQHAAVVVSNYLYVIGGTTGTGDPTSIEYARIYPDGSLGPFQAWNGSLATGRSSAFSAAVVGSTIFVSGGTGNANYESFTVDPSTGLKVSSTSGTLTVTGHTFQLSSNYGWLAIGSYLVLAGSTVTLDSSTVYNKIFAFPVSGATIGAGTVGTFSLPVSYYYPMTTYANGWVYIQYSSDMAGFSFNPNTGAIGSPVNLTTAAAAPSNYYGLMHSQGDMLYEFGGISSNLARISSTSRKADGTLNRWAAYGMVSTARDSYTGQVLNNKAWLIGGATQGPGSGNGSGFSALSTTEYFSIQEDGAVGPAQYGPNLQTARAGATSVVANGFLYVLGGCSNGTYTAVNTIEQAQINADGTLGAFSTLPVGTSVPRMFAASAYIGGYLYLFGGTTSNTMASCNLASIERAKVNDDGSLAPFELLRAQTLPSARSFSSAVVVGDYVYLVGGVVAGNYYTPDATTIYARIDTSGGIGTFRSGPNLSTAVWSPAFARIGSYLYCFGGIVTGASGAGYYSSYSLVQRAALNADGTLQPWASAGVTLPTSVGYFTGPPHIYKNWILLFGGTNTTNNGGLLSANTYVQEAYIQ